MKPPWRSVIMTTALLISGIVAVGVAPNLLAQQELARAQSRWAARDFQRYRMVIETDNGLSQVCRQEVEIENEKVINVVQDCKKPGSFVEQPTVTITDLFNELAKYTSKTATMDISAFVIAYRSGQSSHDQVNVKIPDFFKKSEI